MGNGDPYGGNGGGSGSGGGSGGGSGSSGGSSGGSGGSSGGSGSGGTSHTTTHADPIEAERMNLFQQVYSSLWGEPATEAYLKQAVHSGENRWEFQDREMHKPAFRQTQTYKDLAGQFVAMLERLNL